ncbi:MAG: MerR family transcriptional regulator [bacterium]
MKIAEVTDKTGVSKELTHHYLRQGLLPKSPSRARYSEQQIRLLRQIRTLREDHHLPLEVIRGVFEFFDFEPRRIEALTHADSLARRMTRLAKTGEMLSAKVLSADALIHQAGISSERLAEYVEARLVEPVSVEGRDQYSTYDVKVITLCEQGAQLGMPFDSLRTIGSYVRVAFELEHPVLLDMTSDPELAPERLLGNVIARLEVITSFIQSLLQSRISHQLREPVAPEAHRRDSLDGVIYRPSASFLRLHQLDRLTEDVQRALTDHPEDREHWVHAARVLAHTGRYNEAAFFLEQALERWPADPAIRARYGRALLLSGQPRRAATVLAQADGEPLTLLYRVLTRFVGPQEEREYAPDPAVSVELIKRALADGQPRPRAEQLEIHLLAGWLLTALPRAFHDPAQGFALLSQTLDALERRVTDDALPGLHERLLINAAYLTCEALERCRPAASKDPAAAAAPATPERLRSLICRLDPGCAFAETVYLQAPQQRTDP